MTTRFHTLHRTFEMHARPIGLSLVAVAVVGDYLSGPFMQFPILYVFPVAFMAWYVGSSWAIAASVFMPLVRLAYIFSWDVPWDPAYSTVNQIFRILALCAGAYVIASLSRYTRNLESEVKALQSILPICAFCKRIRDDEQVWHPLEQIITARSALEFSHSICGDCGQKHYPVDWPDDRRSSVADRRSPPPGPDRDLIL